MTPIRIRQLTSQALGEATFFMTSVNTFARHAAVLVAASGLVLTSGMAANAAAAPVQRDSAPASHVDVKGQVSAPVSADSSVKISFERPAVDSVAAPVIEQPKSRRLRLPLQPRRRRPGSGGKPVVQVQAAPAAASGQQRRPRRPRADATPSCWLGRLQPGGHHPGLHRHGGKGPWRRG